METLSVASGLPFSIKDIESTLSKVWRVTNSPNSTLVVHSDGSRAYIYPSSESEQDGLYKLFIDYSDIAFVKRILLTIADNSELTVDNDFGTVLSGDKFAAKCKAETDWNWRQ